MSPSPPARVTFSPFWGWKHKTNTNKLFEQYDVQKNVDILHQVVTEARARRQRGETVDGSTRVDGWRADLQPRAAVRARTIPALERERDSLRARLAEVHFSSIYPSPSSLLGALAQQGAANEHSSPASCRAVCALHKQQPFLAPPCL